MQSDGGDLSRPEAAEAFVIWLDEHRSDGRRGGTIEYFGNASRERFEDLSELPALIERALSSSG